MQQVSLKLIQEVARQFKPFGIYSAEDIEQQAYMFAIQLMDRGYDEKTLLRLVAMRIMGWKRNVYT